MVLILVGETWRPIHELKECVKGKSGMVVVCACGWTTLEPKITNPAILMDWHMVGVGCYLMLRGPFVRLSEPVE